MKKTTNLLRVLGLACLAVACTDKNEVRTAYQQADQHQVIANKYIVTFKDSYVPSGRVAQPEFSSRAEKIAYSAQVKRNVTKKIESFLLTKKINKGNVEHIYSAALSGFVGTLNTDEVEKLKNDPNVLSVEPDRLVTLGPMEFQEEAAPLAQTTTCAITNAGGFKDGSGSSKVIWIVDSGIDVDHPDLNVDAAAGATFVGGTVDDCLGHGTHVAGIAAAKNNGIGVVGVSAGAKVIPVRVFSCVGSSATSIILAGVDFVAANDEPGDVMNMSLGGFAGATCGSTSAYIAAITAVTTGGTRVAVSAGNSAADAALYAPACVNLPRMHTVASMTCTKSFSSFSNYGAPVDWIATGSSVYSTYRNGGYATLSGTSMSSPVVAGIMHARQAGPKNCGTVTFNGRTYKVACVQ